MTLSLAAGMRGPYAHIGPQSTRRRSGSGPARQRQAEADWSCRRPGRAVGHLEARVATERERWLLLLS
jgi:hypothetical protein